MSVRKERKNAVLTMRKDLIGESIELIELLEYLTKKSKTILKVERIYKGDTSEEYFSPTYELRIVVSYKKVALATIRASYAEKLDGQGYTGFIGQMHINTIEEADTL